MEHVILRVELWDGNKMIFNRHGILIRKDWVPQMLSEGNEVEISQCIRNDEGWLVFVYPDEDNIHYYCRTHDKETGRTFTGYGYTMLEKERNEEPINSDTKE